MKERPLLFSAPMVRAGLKDRKSQTRRICQARTQNEADIMAGAIMDDMNGADDGIHEKATWERFGCPYGLPGDRLWVRETWKTCLAYDDYSPSQIDSGAAVQWLADGAKRLNGPEAFGRTRVSIHMPRWASRLTLVVVAVRCERLQDITETDAWKEGIGTEGKPLEALANLCIIYPKTDLGRLAADDMTLFQFGDDRKTLSDYEKVVSTTGRGCFAYLWESINGPGAWARNPWVWVVEFRRIANPTN